MQGDLLMCRRPFASRGLIALALAFSVSGAGLTGAWAKEKKVPDLTKACSKECPNLASNDEVNKCVQDLESKSGEKAFKKEHKSCYKAHEKYEKATGQTEAGETTEHHG
jgi:hypothetical protein